MPRSNRPKMNSLKRLRAKSDLTLEELEKLSGVNAVTISLAENGLRRPYMSTLAKLAEALNQHFKDTGKNITVELEDLLDLRDAPRSTRKPDKPETPE
jgi:transcriptional regulator with XRE-family HTH domain